VEKWHKALGAPLPPGFVLTGNGFFIWLHKTDLFRLSTRASKRASWRSSSPHLAG
jgi:hypothetical protein